MSNLIDVLIRGQREIFTDSDGDFYPGVGDCVNYILPYLDQNAEDKEDKLVFFKLRGNEDFVWKIFKDQLEFAFRNFEKDNRNNVRYNYTIKEGTKTLISHLEIFIDNVLVVESSGPYLTIYPKALKQQMKGFNELNKDVFHLVINDLFG